MTLSSMLHSNSEPSLPFSWVMERKIRSEKSCRMSSIGGECEERERVRTSVVGREEGLGRWSCLVLDRDRFDMVGRSGEVASGLVELIVEGSY